MLFFNAFKSAPAEKVSPVDLIITTLILSLTEIYEKQNAISFIICGCKAFFLFALSRINVNTPLCSFNFKK